MSDTSTKKKRVLVTGGSGNIGAMVSDRLADGYDLVLVDIEEGTTANGLPISRADIRVLDDLNRYMDGVEAVVHLAGDASPEATWESVYELNILGMRNVLEAARLAGVPRVVFASSNHAMGMFDRDGEWPVYNHQLPRPDSLYGVSKVFGETIGRFYHDQYGLEFIALRIGWSTDDVGAVDEDILHAMWLSPDDTAQVIERAIEAKVTFGIYYAISDNPNRRWDLTNTMLDLGYRPKDSWEEALGRSEEIIEGGEPANPDWPRSS
jgi:NAD+ dependent glucose-6-phosphate dehydrogenase